jgi:hypothetical protein
MIKRSFEYFCDNIENVENYEQAKADNFKGWHCHHRLETHNSDGERRLVDLSAEELIALGMYLHRPSEELIFLAESEHHSLHNKGKKMSKEAKIKMSESKKGKHLYEETRKKIGEASKGRRHSEEAKNKLSKSHKGEHKGMHWKVVDGKRVWY